MCRTVLELESQFNVMPIHLYLSHSQTKDVLI